MHTKHWIIAVLVLLVSPGICFAQRDQHEIQRKQKELQRLRDDIQKYEKRIQESEKREQVTLDRLDDLEHQSDLIRQLVQKLHDEELQLTNEIDTARTSIASLENQLHFLQSHYANYVRSVYKNGRVYDLELLFSSKSINQMYIRIQYLKRFSEQRAKDLQGITTNKSELEQKNFTLQDKLQHERLLISEKTHEEKNLNKTYSARQDVLKKIRQDKTMFKKQLVRKTEAYKQIEQIIADLIEKEQIRKEREAAERRAETERRAKELAEAHKREKGTVPPLLPEPEEEHTGENFGHKRGTLRWPVKNGTVQTHFGNQVHPILKTVTQNSGIDIATPVGSSVYAVAAGEVSVITFIPGFGNILIINHYNGYRTVYAHLSDIMVRESQKITEGTVIGKSGDTVERPLLHFEIWKEREKQNPEFWLVKR
jgi:septal ring factor EnvC (AmiA/AmiB activator)